MGPRRFDYPLFHIESDNRLSWFLGRLDQKYGNKALYIHLTRNRHQTAVSFSKRSKRGIMAAYEGGGILMGLQDADPYELALDYISTVDTNIRAFLKDKPHKMDFELEKGKRNFQMLWEEIRGEGNLEAGLAEFDIRHNASEG